MNFERQKSTQEESGVEKIIQRIRQESPFLRQEEGGGASVIERDGEKFKIELIKSPEQPEVEKVHDIMEKTFSSEETEPINTLREAIKGDVPIGEKEPVYYKIHVLKNEKGDVVSCFIGGLLNLKDQEGRDLDQTVFMVAYAVTEKGLRQKSFARELYVSALIDADKESKARGKTLKAFAGETTGTSEKYWNKVGLKRAYIKLGKDNLEEVKYVQPPTERNPKTGKPAKGAGIAPEHFSVAMMDGRQEIDGREVLEIVDAFNRWCYKWKRSEFDNNDAFILANKQVDAMEEKLKKQFSRGESKLILLDREGRLNVQKSGTIIHEHTAADKVENKAGEEDL